MDKNDFSPDLNDLIERIPDRFNTLMVVGLTIFLLGLVLAGVFIKSPDKVVAEVRISSIRPPVVMKAKTSGRVRLLLDSLPRQCSRGEYIAVIDNSGNPQDVRRLLDHILQIDPLEYEGPLESLSGMSIGVISSYYSTFIQAVHTYNDLKAPYNQYSYEIDSAVHDIMSDSISIDYYKRIMDEDLQNLAIHRKEYETDSLLFVSDAILENEFNQSRLEYINIRKQVISEQNMIDEARQSISRQKSRIINLRYQYDKEVTKAEDLLLESYNTLLAQILSWEDMYVFKSDADGVVEFATLLSDNAFIAAGEPAFTVIPEDNEYSGIAILPFSGSGKVMVGQKVNIKLASYPHAEYGTLPGIVRTISQSSTEEGYLIYIELPEGLVSTNGTELIFAETMYGTAEIITKDKRLIDKIFYHVYNLISRNNENK